MTTPERSPDGTHVTGTCAKCGYTVNVYGPEAIQEIADQINKHECGKETKK